MQQVLNAHLSRIEQRLLDALRAAQAAGQIDDARPPEAESLHRGPPPARRAHGGRRGHPTARASMAAGTMSRRGVSA